MTQPETDDGSRGGPRRLRAGLLGMLAIQVVVIALYAPTLGHELVWDDKANVRDNPVFEGPLIDGLQATQHDHFDPHLRRLRGVAPAHESYRPLVFLSYRLDYALWNDCVTGMHAHNLFVASLSIWLVFLLALRLLGSVPLALAVAGIFALHPIQVEPIAYISARGDLLAGLWILVSLLLLHRRPTDGAAGTLRLVGGVLAFLVSLLCKEAYIGLPAVLLLLGWWKGELRQAARDAGIVLVAAIAYVAVRSWALGGPTSGNIPSAAFALPGIWLQYARTALSPTALSTETLLDPSLQTPGVMALALTSSLLVYFRLRPDRSSEAGVALGLLWALVFMGPSAIVATLHRVVADRYAYLPLFGFALALVLAVERATARRRTLRRTAAAALVGLLGLYGVMTHLQQQTWQSDETLYTNAVVSAPTSSMAWYRLGYLQASRGDLGAALPLFVRATELDPDNVSAWNNLGVSLLRIGRPADAMGALRTAIQRSHNTKFNSWYNLALAQEQLGQQSDACASVRRALRINPDYLNAVRASKRMCPPTEERD